MSVPLSFLLGTAMAFLAGETVEWLPGEARFLDFLLGCLFLPLPMLWVTLAGRALLAAQRAGRRPGVAARLALRIAMLAVPLGVAALVGLGGWHDHVERLAPDSHTARFALLLLPAAFLEAQFRIAVARLTSRVLAQRADVDLPFEGGTAPMVALVVVCALLLGVAMDLAAFSSSLHVFFGTTALGTTLGLLLLVVGGSAFLPLLFRFLLPTSRRLPERIAVEVREIAARLGFRPSGLLALDTGLRIVNAALVGPLRWPRYLVLTDGILTYLDAPTLRGVVAHEVGHARAGHPALIVLVILVLPILLVEPVAQLELESVDPWLLIGAGAAATAIAFVAIRALMHRFEYEADHLSAHALGGADPCIAALVRVGELFPGHGFRASFRHPSEVDRVQELVAHANDPRRGLRFRRRGRRLRIGLGLFGVAVLMLSVFAHARAFAGDMATHALYTSRFDEARTWLDSAPEDDPRVDDLRTDLDAADALRLSSAEPRATRMALADPAFARAIELAAGGDLTAARPYFALALAIPRDDPVRLSAWLWSLAAVDGDGERVERIATHLVALSDTPPGLRDAIARTRAAR